MMNDSNTEGAIGTLIRPHTSPRSQPNPDTETPWLWNIVLYDSDEHTYEYVIDMLAKLFGFSAEHAFLLAVAIDCEGRGVVLTTHREHAELKAEQIRGYGPDPRIASCRAPLRVALEPAESE